MELSLDAYNFLAEKNNWTKVSNLEELDIGCKEHYIRKFSSMINVSDHSLRSNLYIWGINEDLTCILGMIKEINGEVIEHYTKVPTNFKFPIKDDEIPIFASRDLSTNEILEYYSYEIEVNEVNPPKREMKYNMKGELLQTNHMITKFDELPKEFQNALSDYPYKDKIRMYANKPYGMIVEIFYI
jgi:hypothetical protein